WVGERASVLEYVFAGTRRAGEVHGVKVGEKRVGLAAATVVTFDRDGLVKSERAYLDLATTLGQLDPRLLPAGSHVRAVPLGPPAGADVLESKGTPAESRNLDTLNKLYG